MGIDKPATTRRVTELLEWLARTGTTQQTLARLLDVSESQVSLYINGKRNLSIENVIKLALLTDIPVEKLFMDSASERLLKLLGKRVTSATRITRKKSNVA